MVRSRSIAILSIVATIGVGGVATASTPPASRTVNAPTASNQTVRLHVGDKLRVHLPTSFRRPTSSQPNVLKRISSWGGYPTTDDAHATFQALAVGRSDVSSETDYACLHATPRCEIAQQVWVVHVIVTP